MDFFGICTGGLGEISPLAKFPRPSCSGRLDGAGVGLGELISMNHLEALPMNHLLRCQPYPDIDYQDEPVQGSKVSENVASAKSAIFKHVSAETDMAAVAAFLPDKLVKNWTNKGKEDG